MLDNTMPETTDEVFQALRQKVHSEPALQVQLFELIDAREFWLAVRRIAEELGLSLDEQTLHAALREGVRGWHESQMP